MADKRIVVDRETAHRINPLIGSGLVGDTMSSCREVVGLIQQLTNLDQRAGNELHLSCAATQGLYRLCDALDAALEYEEYGKEGLPESRF